MGGRTHAVTEGADWVCHVRFMIGAVQVHTVPAGREVHLGTHAIGALMIEEVGALCPVRITAVVSIIICAKREYRPMARFVVVGHTKTHIADGLIGFIRGVIHSTIIVSCEQLIILSSANTSGDGSAYS